MLINAREKFEDMKEDDKTEPEAQEKPKLP